MRLHRLQFHLRSGMHWSVSSSIPLMILGRPYGSKLATVRNGAEIWDTQETALEMVGVQVLPSRFSRSYESVGIAQDLGALPRYNP